jgi:large subunit ribosomal protein L21
MVCRFKKKANFALQFKNEKEAMYAIVDIAGQQFKVEKDQEIFVHRLDEKAGAKVEFNQVLLTDDKGKITVGKPIIEGAQVTAKIVEHLRGDKVMVFKKKRRKGYKKMNGHRDELTKIIIQDVVAKGAKAPKAAAEKKEEAPKAKEAATKKPAAKAVKETAKKTTKAAKPAEVKTEKKETAKPKEPKAVDQKTEKKEDK